MAQRAKPYSESEPEDDAWSATWGDRALQNLGRRLESYGIAEEQAALIVEQTWLFYSYVALPTLQKRLPMGIATDSGEIRPVIWYFIGFSAHETSSGQISGTENLVSLQETFARDFAAPLADQIAMRLEPFRTPTERLAWELGSPKRLEALFCQYAASQQLDCVGLFIDDLEAELRTIMAPELVPLWLDTPNKLFSWRRPAEYLDDPLDRQLRGVITRAKFNLPAA